MLSYLTDVYKDTPVLITGHTGFKGSWLSIWLHLLGAQVIGYSLDPPTTPSNFEASRVGERVTDVRGDVRDLSALTRCFEEHQPRIVFHLAAQPIVLEAYRLPKETFDINVGGTVKVMEAIRLTNTVRALVCVTTDKVYENQEWMWGYREIDSLGGHDPYSASKAMAELAIASYRRSFFPRESFAEHGVALASARAGNVIGGGDWAPHRLVPDCMRALMENTPIYLRNPRAVRPWQHVLESLSAYLWLGARLFQPDGNDYAEAWNFGPFEHQSVATEQIVKQAIALWGSGTYEAGNVTERVETQVLGLNWEKAAKRLQWRPCYTWKEAVEKTTGWFKRFNAKSPDTSPPDMYAVCSSQIMDYTKKAFDLNIAWSQ